VDEAESSSSTHKPSPPRVVGDRYRLGKKLGSGSYSDVHLAVDKITGEKFAVKLEWKHAEKTNKLLNEAKLYQDLVNDVGVPRVHWAGSIGEYNIMVLDLLGPSLDDLFKKHKRFSVKTVLMLAKQMIDRLKYVHDCGILYRDIKPHNFLMGLGDRGRGRVYLVDFGLAKRYRDEETGTHCALHIKKGRGVTGTVRYSSLNVHEGYDASRRDDLLALGYVLLHFLRGGLPWLGINAKSKKTKHELIRRRKNKVPDEELCAGLPNEFVEYFRYCRSLEFYDRPDYIRLQKLLDGVMIREGYANDLRFDWTVKEESERRRERSQEARRESRDAKRRRR
jgi:serine/threonine protein kinase